MVFQQTLPEISMITDDGMPIVLSANIQQVFSAFSDIWHSKLPPSQTSNFVFLWSQPGFFQFLCTCGSGDSRQLLSLIIIQTIKNTL